MAKADWRKLGVIAVESGICMVGDPGFVLGQEKLPRELGPDWAAFTARVRERESSGDAAQLFYDRRPPVPGLAVAVHTAFGDGTYGVWGRFDDEGCLELRIRFDRYEDWEPGEPPREARPKRQPAKSKKTPARAPAKAARSRK